VVQNKARLVAQGYNQEEEIDFDETYSLIAIMESICILLAFTYFKNIKISQMNVKRACLNGYIQNEVYVEQFPGFESHNFPNHVLKLKRILYGLSKLLELDMRD